MCLRRPPHQSPAHVCERLADVDTPPGEVDPVVGPNEEPPQETPPSPAAANYNGAVQANPATQGNQSMQGNQAPPPPAQPQMPPPTRVMGGPAAGQPVTQ